jgi:hypothetical protein
MRKLILDISNFILNIVLVVGAVVSIGSILVQVLPADIVEPILAWFNTRIDLVLPAGITTMITTIVLGCAKYFTTMINLMLNKSEFKQDLQRKQLQASYNERLDVAEQRDMAIVELINKQSELLKVIIEQNKYITEYEKLVALKNISSSIIPAEYKAKFKAWVEGLDVENTTVPSLSAEEVVATTIDETPDNTKTII